MHRVYITADVKSPAIAYRNLNHPGLQRGLNP